MDVEDFKEVVRRGYDAVSHLYRGDRAGDGRYVPWFGEPAVVSARMDGMTDHKERMLRGDLYLASDPELVTDHQRCRLLVERFNATGVTEGKERRDILVSLLGHLGDGVEVKPPLQCDYGWLIQVGARSFVNYGAVILDCAPVTIGDDVQIGPAVQLLTATHPLDAAVRRDGWESAHPITVGDGAWVGGGAIVCPGVAIGEEAVVGAGSVVTKNVPARVLAAGNPCRVIREL